jgi:putative ABC transport system permease protein
MASVRQFLLRLVSVFRSGHAEDDLAREVNSHLALLEEGFRAGGMSAEDARLAARRSFGGVDQAKERQRDTRSFRWIEDLQQDVRYAVRSLRRSTAFTAAAMLTLSIGIGATTAIFSIVDTVLVQPLPLADSDRIVVISEPERPRTAPGGNYTEFLEWRSRMQSIELAAHAFNPQVIMPTREGTARLTAAMISHNFFEVMGVEAAIGRVIGTTDEGTSDLVVLSHGAWQTYFRSDPAAVGSVIELRGSLASVSNLGSAGQSGRLMTVVGVLPEHLDAIFSPHDFFTPFVVTPNGRPPGAGLRGRLRRGVSLAQAQEEANVIGAAVRPPRAASDPPLTRPRFVVEPFKEGFVREIRPALRVFVWAVGVVLLIVCANVANLLLARGNARAREIALRLAIGASRARIVRQILTECLVLAVTGGLIGAALAAVGINLVKQLATIDAQGVFRLSFGGHLLPRINEVGVDARVLLIAVGLAILSSVVFGLLPAIQLSRVSHLQAMGARGGGSSRREARTRTALVVSQLVLATVLLVGAGLLLNSFMNLSEVEKGYDPSRALAFQLVLPNEYSTVRKTTTVESLLAALRQLPEVEAAGFAYAGILLGLEDTIGTFTPPGRTHDEMLAEQKAGMAPRVKSLSHGYLQAMGVPLLSGRYLDERDQAAAPFTVVINRTVARRFFGDGNPVGTTMIWRPGRIDFPVEIVGVVEDVRQGRVDRPAYAEIFMDFRQVMEVHQRMKMSPQRIEQMGLGFLSFGVRTRGNPANAMPAVRRVVRTVDGNAGIDAMHTMDRMVGFSMARQRLYAVLLGIFAGVAGLLAAIGVYGVLAYAVVQRTQEIGIRMALGAERGQVMALIMRRGVALASIGIITGLIGAFAGTRYLQSMLFGVEPRDPATFAAVAVTFAVVAAAAAYLPARRATRVDPMVALRVE